MLALYFSSELTLAHSNGMSDVNADKAFTMQSVLQSQTSSVKKNHVPGISVFGLSVFCMKLNYSPLYRGQDRLEIIM